MSPRQTKSPLFFALLLFFATTAIVAALVIYRINDIPELEPEEIATNTTEETTTDEPVLDENMCLLEVQSDPAEANITINGTPQGVTPTQLTVPCKTDVDIQLSKEGYIAFRRNDFVSRRKHRVYAPLKAIPLGTLLITLSQDATIYVNDAMKARAIRNTPVELKLPANHRYTLRFENRRLGIKEEREYFIRKDQQKEETIRLVGSRG